MRVEEILVTPKYAAELLAHNSKNRKIRTNKVAMYAELMRKGRWKRNTGEFIKVSHDGRLLDGQHRLMAVIKAGVPVYIGIVQGINSNVFDVLDTGMSRTAGDVMTIAGVKNGKLLARIFNLYLSLKHGHATTKSNNVLNTNDVMLELYESAPEFWQRVALKTSRWYTESSHLLTQRTLGAFYTIFHEINPELANEFFNQLTDIKNVTNSTIKVLRKKLNDGRNIKNATIPETYTNALIIKTWNCFISGRELVRLSFDGDNEEFPKIASPKSTMKVENLLTTE